MSYLLYVSISANGGYYYDLIYLITFLLGYLLLFWVGLEKRYHLVSWMLALASSRFFLIIGSKLFSYAAHEWQQLLSAHYLPPTTRKSLLGGLLLAIIGFFLLKKLLQLKNEALDAFALVLPLSIALQRLGCLLAGCCHGTPTTLPWGVQYLPGTLPHYHQFKAGLIQAQALYALPVHPTPLYEALGGLLVAGGLLWGKRFIKTPGNTFSCAIILYGLVRFFTEFFRSSSPASAAMPGGLKLIQWLILLIIALLVVLFLYREKQGRSESYTPQAPALPATVFILLAMVFTAWGLRNWFTYAELLALNMALLPAIGFVSVYSIPCFFIPQYRWMGLGILGLPLFLMSQTWPLKMAGNQPDSLPQTLASSPDAPKARSFHTFKIGYGSGSYQNMHTIGQGSGCDRVTDTRYFQQEYTLWGAGYAVTRQQEEAEISYGLNAYGGTHHETDITFIPFGERSKTIIWGLNPYLRYDREMFGIGGGLHLGSLLYTLDNPDKDGTGTPTSGARKTPLYPQLSLRVGPTRFIFADFHLADHFPAAFPGLRYQAGIGSGLGIKNGTFFKYGITGIDQFISGHLVLDKRLVVEPLILWGKSDTPASHRQRQFSIGLHYRFNHKD